MNARLSHALRELRGTARYRVGRLIARLAGSRAVADRIEAASISSVLVCRINARMGNAIFLTPLVERLGELLPHASIDIASAYSQAGDLLGRLAGVRRVIRFPHKGVRLPYDYLAALGAVRRESYDLVIDPTPSSTSSRIVLMLARARFRLGYATTDQWASLTHAVPAPEGRVHQAALPVRLVNRALGATDDLGAVRLWLPLEPRELEAGRGVVERAIEERGGGGGRSRAFGFFAHATGLKTLEPAYWRAFWDAFLELEPEAIPVEILPSPRSAPTDPRSASFHVPTPRALAAAMAAMRLFISADTGPMHLAGTTSVPTIALFTASDPTLYGPLKPGDLAIDANRLSPREAAERCRQMWRGAGERTGPALEAAEPASKSVEV